MTEKEKQRKEVFLVNDMGCSALSHFIFTNQNYVFAPVPSTAKAVHVTNYHITM